MDDQFFKDRGVTFLVGKQALKFDRVPQRAETLTLTSRAQVSKHGSVKRITTPVSYTHLDVYKRQVYHRGCLQQAGL